MKIVTFKEFFKNGVWTIETLDYFKSKNLITEDEYNEIINTPTTYNEVEEIEPIEITWELWDKKTPINGVPAEKYIENMGLKNANDIILIKYNGCITEVHDVEVTKNNMRLPRSYDLEMIAERIVEKTDKEVNAPTPPNVELFNLGNNIYNDIVRTEEIKEIKNLLLDIKTSLK